MNRKQPAVRPSRRRMPLASAEDVEFSRELADGEDRKAQARAEAADRRQRERT